MKKALSLILVLVLCLSLCACGDNKSNEIELTAQNFETYVRIDRKNVITDTYSNGDYLKAYAVLDLSGASTNYNYNDVSITYKITNPFTCPNHGQQNFEITLTAKTDISGHCYAGKDISVGLLSCRNCDSGRAKPNNFRWEIVSVTGTLTPAG